MAFKIQELMDGGNINVFKLDGPEGNYVLTIAFTDMGFVIPLLTVPGTGQVAYLGSSLTAEQEINIQDLIKTSLKKLYQKLPKYEYCLSKPAPTHSMKIASYVQPSVRGNKGDDKLLFKYLQDAGYDTTELTTEMKTSLKERDYSALRATPEGKLRYEIIEEIVKSINGSVSKCSRQIQIAYESIKQGKSNGVFLSGPAGTGKSVAACIMSHDMGAPLLTYQATEGMQIEDMVGQFVPSDKVGQFEFKPGLLLKAYYEGYQMVINEINTAPAGILAILNQFADDTPTYTAPNGITYKKHPNFVLYLTLNPGYEGTQILNPALKSRFSKVVVPPLTQEEFIARMLVYSRNRCGCPLSEDFYKELYGFQNIIIQQAQNSSEIVAICIRNAQQLTDDITTHSMTQDEFAEAVHLAYTNNTYMDNDNLTHLQDFIKSDELQNKIDRLFQLYNYKVLVSVEVTTSYKDSIETAPTASTTKKKGKRTIDDFDDDELNSLEGIDDAIADKLSEEIEEDENSPEAAKPDAEAEEDEETEDLADEEDINE